MNPSKVLDSADNVQEMQRRKEHVELNHMCVISKILTVGNCRSREPGPSLHKLQERNKVG